MYFVEPIKWLFYGPILSLVWKKLSLVLHYYQGFIQTDVYGQALKLCLGF